jgi:signal transduction histidine kinase
MASSPPSPPHSPEERIAELFRRADHEVQQTVGLEPGTIDWFATPRSGFVRPRTYFRALAVCPDDIRAILDGLEAARTARGADRAMVVVMTGALPSGYAPDLHHRTTNVFTLRRWLLEVSGVAEQVRGIAQSYASRGGHRAYMPRRGRLSSGDEVQVEPYLDAWVERAGRPTLLVKGAALGGKASVITQTVCRAALRFEQEPEAATPLVDVSRYDVMPILLEVAFDEGFAVPTVSRWVDGGATRGDVRWPALSAAYRGDDEFAPDDGALVLELLPPPSDEVGLWLRERLGADELADVFDRARLRHPSFRSLSDALPNAGFLLAAIRSQSTKGATASLDQWLASVVIEYMKPLAGRIDRLTGPADRLTMPALEDRALYEFALGVPIQYEWFKPEVGGVPKPVRTWFDPHAYRFRNNLLRDYFLARKVAREAEAGNVEIFLRYQFPPSVFLFLTNLAPELSAKVAEGTFTRLEEKMQEEVERKLHLTFAHLLNRPVGMIRAHLNEVREAIGKEKAAELARPFAKIEAEIDYINNLAERTRLWQSKPEEAVEPIPLRPLVEEVARSLQGQHPAVALFVEVAPEVQVRAMRGALRDLLQCLLENAFHAAPNERPTAPPSVAVRARAVGDILRIEIRDTGAGVPSEDRERIFEPLVTTKKGGTGKPRGTGYGLPIARRFAEYMGGRVGLDAECEETCFFVDLVPWRENA